MDTQAIDGRQEATRRRLLESAPAAECLPTAPLKLRNRLAEHPVFEDERIKELLRRLPRERIEIRSVETTRTQSGQYLRGPMQDIDPVAAFEGLAERPTWMLLHDTWKHDPDYRDLRDEYIQDLSEQFPEMRDGLYDMGCWMFLSSGSSVVHFHADADQSFLNNVRGGKTVYLYPADILSDETIEELLGRMDQGAVVYDPAYEPHALPPIHLGPGETAFLPLYAPHRVVNDDTLCVSWNVGFNTRRSRARRNVHLVNRDLRSMGLSPRAFGASAWRDALKARLHLPIRLKNKLLRTAGLRQEQTG